MIFWIIDFPLGKKALVIRRKGSLVLGIGYHSIYLLFGLVFFDFWSPAICCRFKRSFFHLLLVILINWQEWYIVHGSKAMVTVTVTCLSFHLSYIFGVTQTNLGNSK